MKKTFLLTAICVVLACLTGCGAGMPDVAADGTPWSEEWTTLGQTLGVEKPGHGLTPRDNKVARNMYYASWSIGEPQSYVSSSGEETNLYDAQLVLLLAVSDTPEEAQESVNEWLSLAEDSYTIASTGQQTFNGQEFTVLTYTFSSDTSPLSHGVSAFTTYGAYAISAEFVCQDTFDGDASEIVTDFLGHFHYAANET